MSDIISKLLVLNTGGTITMIRNEKGDLAPPSSGKLIENIRNRSNMHDPSVQLDDLETSCALPHTEGEPQIVYTIKELDPLLDSSNVGAEEWELIARKIKDNYAFYQGFVILHGTDTIAYSAAALSFMFENLSKPVILTGSQLSIVETRTDGITNFINSLYVASLPDIKEVCVVFGKKIIRGNRTAKISSVDFEAFDSPNAPLLGQIQKDAKIDHKAIFNLHNEDSDLKIQDNLNTNIVMLRITPNMPITLVRESLKPPTKAVILQCFGSGNIPSKRQDILDELTAASGDVILVITTQCRHGSAEPIYETGRALADCGAIRGYDMTEEAVYTKLAYILAQTDLSFENKKMKMQENLRGELTLPSNQQAK